ncbi:hypothetical protein [Flavobacterium silvaticum]|uniref:YtxH domain-containing protein n=1 Tax=Flavobacterium silvaticum TaxID=1852020 RepID=A0A972JHC7_9FLAO|nr:hypothetical protein [Flavobacterium silvaticum]NMH27795.1 hypothetical protein [Flavobacterium silvaticum]
MKDKRIIAGVAIGVAALAAVGILLAYKKKSKKDKFLSAADDAANRFKGKLSSLERKARKEYKNLVHEGEDLAGKAREWADKARLQ